MKINSGNFILGLMVSLVLLFFVFWVVRIQTQKDFPDVTSEIINTEEFVKSVLRGKELFKKESCYNCHKPGKKQHPDFSLINISARRSKEFLFQFIRNEQLMIDEGNTEVIALKEAYNWANGLHNKKHLTDTQIQDILNYLDSF